MLMFWVWSHGESSLHVQNMKQNETSIQKSKAWFILHEKYWSCMMKFAFFFFTFLHDSWDLVLRIASCQSWCVLGQNYVGHICAEKWLKYTDLTSAPLRSSRLRLLENAAIFTNEIVKEVVEGDTSGSLWLSRDMFQQICLKRWRSLSDKFTKQLVSSANNRNTKVLTVGPLLHSRCRYWEKVWQRQKKKKTFGTAAIFLSATFISLYC